MRGSEVPKADGGGHKLRDTVRDFDLPDVTEVLGSFSPRFPRWQGASHAKLDRVYVSKELSDGIQSYETRRWYLSPTTASSPPCSDPEDPGLGGRSNKTALGR